MIINIILPSLIVLIIFLSIIIFVVLFNIYHDNKDILIKNSNDFLKEFANFVSDKDKKLWYIPLITFSLTSILLPFIYNSYNLILSIVATLIYTIIFLYCIIKNTYLIRNRLYHKIIYNILEIIIAVLSFVCISSIFYVDIFKYSNLYDNEFYVYYFAIFILLSLFILEISLRFIFCKDTDSSSEANTVCSIFLCLTSFMLFSFIISYITDLDLLWCQKYLYITISIGLALAGNAINFRIGLTGNNKFFSPFFMHFLYIPILLTALALSILGIICIYDIWSLSLAVTIVLTSIFSIACIAEIVGVVYSSYKIIDRIIDDIYD